MKKALFITLISLTAVVTFGIAFQFVNINRINHMYTEASSAHSVILKQITDNKDEIESINAEIGKLGNDIEDSTAHISEQEEVLNDLERNISEKESSIQNLVNEDAELDESISALNVSVEVFGEKIEELNNRVTELSN